MRTLSALALLLALVSCSSDEPEPLTQQERDDLDAAFSEYADAQDGSEVTYRFDGSAKGDITIETPTGTSQQKASPGWSQSFTFAADDFIYISIQNQSGQGYVACTIEVDGVQVSFNEAQGGYGIASCDGTV